MNLKRFVSVVCLSVLCVGVGVKACSVCQPDNISRAGIKLDNKAEVILSKAISFDYSNSSLENSKCACELLMEIDQVLKEYDDAVLKKIIKKYYSHQGDYTRMVVAIRKQDIAVVSDSMIKLINIETKLFRHVINKHPFYACAKVLWKPIVTTVAVLGTLAAIHIAVQKGFNGDYKAALAKVSQLTKEYAEKLHLKELAIAAKNKSIEVAKVAGAKSVEFAAIAKDKCIQGAQVVSKFGTEFGEKASVAVNAAGTKISKVGTDFANYVKNNGAEATILGTYLGLAAGVIFGCQSR